MTAVGEVRTRLQQLETRTEQMRADILGEGQSDNSGPAALPAAHLDGRVYELFQLLTNIEENVGRVMSRLGVGANTVQTQKGRAVGY